MKRKLFLIVASLLLCGTMFAQDYHWTGLVYTNYQSQMSVIAKVYFDGVVQNRGDIEVAGFVGDELRGTEFLENPYPNSNLGYFTWTTCYLNTEGETFTFKAYDHASGIEYDICETQITGVADETIGTVREPVEMYFTRTVEPTYGPDYPWIPVTENDYEGEGMLVVAQVKINGQVVDRASYEVGAFCGEECRAISGDELDDWTDDNLGYFAFMNILGNNGDIINFYLYDLENDCNFAGSCNTTVELENGGELGLDIYGGDIFVLNFVTVNTYIKTIEACTTKGGWYLISSPIGDVDPDEVDGMLENSYDLYRFNQSVEKEWENYKDTEYGHNHFGLELGKGYLYANSNKTDLIFTGDAYEGDSETITLTYDGGADLPGWNLVGNPFADTAYIDRTLFYVMNSDREEVEAGTGNAVEPMEGIFVVAEGQNESVTFSTEDPGKAIHQLVVNLNGSNRGGSIDRAIVRFENNHFLPKFQLFEDNTKLYIPQDGKDYAVVSAEDHGELPMNFKAAKNGSYTISFNTENVTMSYLHLIDNLTGNDVDLIATPSYTFNAQTNDYASRFKLVFATGESTSDDFAFISDGSLIINGQGTLQVFDVTGRMISSNRIDGLHTVSTNGMAAGVYMLNLINGNNAKTQKIVVK